MSSLKFMAMLGCTLILWNYAKAESTCLENEENCWECGENCTARLDAAGKFTVSGTGAMDNYTWQDGKNTAPWYNYNYRSKVVSIEIEDGITSIGNRAFQDMPKLDNINIPNSVTSIGFCSFEGTDALTSIVIPDSVTSISSHAFNYNSVKKSIYCTGKNINNGLCTEDNNWGIGGANADVGIIHYEKEGNHYNIYDEEGKIVAQYKNFADFGTDKMYQRRTSYTPAEAAALIKKGNDNKITFTFK